MAKPRVEISLLKAEDADAAFDVATQVFVEGSTLHQALGISLDDYRKYLKDPFSSMIAEGLSVVANDSSTGEVLGCMIVTDFRNQFEAGATQNEKFLPLSSLTLDLCQQYFKGHPPSVGDAILVDMGAVSPAARGLGLYKQMRNKVHAHARQLGFKRVVGELSSAATQHHVLHQLHHKPIAEVKFADFEFNGTYPFRSITEPESIVLSLGDL